jgi:hypothetical protein
MPQRSIYSLNDYDLALKRGTIRCGKERYVRGRFAAGRFEGK